MKYVTLLWLLTTSIANATIYMQTDAQGNVSYTDTPSATARPVELPTTNSAPILNPATETTPSKSGAKAAIAKKSGLPAETVPYTAFTITSPKEQENIQNQPTVGVDVTVEPALQEGDQILVILDGRVIGAPSTTTHIDLGLVERGEHQVVAVLIDSSQKVIRESNAVRFFVHRNSINTSPASQVRPAPKPPT